MANTVKRILESMFMFLEVAGKLDNASIREIGMKLEWGYERANKMAKALESLGFIKLELEQGPPRRYVVKLTEKGKCILTCNISSKEPRSA